MAFSVWIVNIYKTTDGGSDSYPVTECNSYPLCIPVGDTAWQNVMELLEVEYGKGNVEFKSLIDGETRRGNYESKI